MDIQIIQEKDMPLLSRKMVELEAGFTGSKTPSNAQIKEEAAKILKANPKLVVIRRISQSYGSATARVLAYVYSDEETMKSFEKESKAKYEPPKKESNDENQSAEAKEEPKEEKKEETSKETEEKTEPKKEESKQEEVKAEGGEESGKEEGKE